MKKFQSKMEIKDIGQTNILTTSEWENYFKKYTIRRNRIKLIHIFHGEEEIAISENEVQKITFKVRIKV